MASKNGKPAAKEKMPARLHPDIKKSVLAIFLIGLAIVLFLAGFDKAGPAGELIYGILNYLLGIGYFALPVVLVLVAGVFLISERDRIFGITFLGSGVLIIAILGLVDLISNEGGILGKIFGSLRYPFGQTAALIIDVIFLLASFIITLNVPLKIKIKKEKKETSPQIIEPETRISTALEAKPETKEEKESQKLYSKGKPSLASKPKIFKPDFKNYLPPPLNLLRSSVEKPMTGDLRANANIIKRTLENFGIPVEMGEINVGPKVTRYTLKPADGIKLSRITALSQDLALALAAHPIRIEAPIPGKSLVGIEVPNKAAAFVRLGSLLGYEEFQKSPLLNIPLGRDVSGNPIFADIEKMPHLLIAGATGSGKSVIIHSIIVSLLYKNSPATLKMILIDPKRVELSVYEGLPHLINPVITESRKTFAVFKWAIEEMDNRYDTLLKAGRRDIQSYNANLKGEEKVMPYILIVIDELADLMTSYGREVEGFIVRLAQMARATGLHLILSTQRPSVEIVTGLIKANITSRIALQVASQVDSRTILDVAGAEKLLGAGDFLFVSSEFSKPKRIQGPYLSEEEIEKVISFIKEKNKNLISEEELEFSAAAPTQNLESFEDYLEETEDELYDEAVKLVAEAKKASASLLQRRLSVGYARAARLLDLMENNGLIGPGDGAKPREVFLEQVSQYLSSKT